uniref:Uncharacterized protein n=1 Tax=Trichogramma kaykai TaxID=54128 RepID=A0ABD2XGM2_9HYME
MPEKPLNFFYPAPREGFGSLAYSATAALKGYGPRFIARRKDDKNIASHPCARPCIKAAGSASRNLISSFWKQDINEEPPIEEANGNELIDEELVNFQEVEPNVQALQDHTMNTRNAEFNIGKWLKKVSDTEKYFWIKNCIQVLQNANYDILKKNSFL